jgi:hypothetical protein
MVTRSSVIVTELHLEGVAVNEPKAEAPLVVHGDRVLALAITAEGVQSIPSRDAQVVQPLRSIEQVKLVRRPMNEVGWDPPRNAFAEQGFGPFVGEALDHGRM